MTINEIKPVDFKQKCPNCLGVMANGNKFCCLRCYNEYNGIIEVKR